MSLAQNHSQAWIWQPTMNPQPHLNHHYYNQLTQQQQQQQQAENYMRERMFEKPLTPSDVGKLNRLVIPKQNAERYFPLDGESGEKGLLLSFEDADEGPGKTWKFRYSYWTSSQSYVLTKGWSRFIKEKRLDAGDTVLFERSGGRLFIGCRRRSSGEATSSPYPSPYVYRSSVGSGEQAGSPARTEAGSSRRMLRLFGVNLDCGPEPQQHLVSESWGQFTATNASTSQF